MPGCTHGISDRAESRSARAWPYWQAARVQQPEALAAHQRERLRVAESEDAAHRLAYQAVAVSERASPAAVGSRCHQQPGVPPRDGRAKACGNAHASPEAWNSSESSIA